MVKPTAVNNKSGMLLLCGYFTRSFYMIFHPFSMLFSLRRPDKARKIPLQLGASFRSLSLTAVKTTCVSRVLECILHQKVALCTSSLQWRFRRLQENIGVRL